MQVAGVIYSSTIMEAASGALARALALVTGRPENVAATVGNPVASASRIGPGTTALQNPALGCDGL
jgi:hypothetical protein